MVARHRKFALEAHLVLARNEETWDRGEQSEGESASEELEVRHKKLGVIVYRWPVPARWI